MAIYKGIVQEPKKHEPSGRRMRRVRMAMQLLGLSYEDHQRAAAELDISEHVGTDSQGRSLEQWWHGKARQVTGRCPDCGVTVIQGASECTFCGEPLPDIATGPMVSLSETSKELWDALPGPVTGKEIGWAVAGVVMVVAGVVVFML